jgi:hypothetical protein
LTFASFVHEHKPTIECLLKEGGFTLSEIKVLKDHGFKVGEEYELNKIRIFKGDTKK